MGFPQSVYVIDSVVYSAGGSAFRVGSWSNTEDSLTYVETSHIVKLSDIMVTLKDMTRATGVDRPGVTTRAVATYWCRTHPLEAANQHAV
jgi:hypothetical protein